MTIELLLSVVVYLIIIGAVCWLLWWLIGYAALPEPFAKIARVLVALVAVFIVIAILLSLAGPLPKLR